MLTKKQLKVISGPYEYRCQNETILDPMFQIYWQWLSKKLPSNLAPNIMTYAGLALNIMATLVLLSRSPDAKEKVGKLTLEFVNIIFQVAVSLLGTTTKHEP